MFYQPLSAEVFAYFLVFTRLGATLVVLPGIGEQYISVRVRLLFGFEDKQVKVVGTIRGSVTLDCSRCNLPVDSELSVSIDALVFESEDRLQSWLDQGNDLMDKEVVVSGPSLNLIDLVEDELILGLPRAICRQCKSDNEENYVYSSGPKVVNKSPFAGLSDLSSS